MFSRRVRKMFAFGALSALIGIPLWGITRDQYKRAMKNALEQVITQSQRAQSQSRTRSAAAIDFSANLFFAHEAVIEHIPTEILLKHVTAFRDMGLRRIDINPGLFPWMDGKRTDVIEKYDAVINAARRAGMKIILNPQYSVTYHKVRSYDEWTKAAMPVYRELARRYKPHTFVVIHEPSTMAKRMGARISTDQWRRFVAESAAEVRRVSPQTRIGAGGLFTERDAYNAFLGLDEVDVMTINIYNVRAMKTYNQMIEQAKSRGKPVYIAETWRPPYFTREKRGASLETLAASSVGDKEFADLDVLWLEAMVAYAVAWQLESVTPFWSQTFFRYVQDDESALSPAYNREVVAAIERGERTQLFHRYRELIRQHGGR